MDVCDSTLTVEVAEKQGKEEKKKCITIGISGGIGLQITRNTRVVNVWNGKQIVP